MIRTMNGARISALIAGFFVGLVLEGAAQSPAPSGLAGVPYGIADKKWADSLGNHRAVIRVSEAAFRGSKRAYRADNDAGALELVDAVRIEIPWRRRDQPSDKGVIITDSAGKLVEKLMRVKVSQEKGEFIFQPGSGAGQYYVYYLPWKGKKNMGWFEGDYLRPEQPADRDWMNRQRALLSGSSAAPKKLPVALVTRLEARTSFDSFYPMEMPATAAELVALQKKVNKDFIIFPEDRKYPIRMQETIPQRWIEQGVRPVLQGKAMRNEYYTFQIGLYAAKKDVRNLHLSYGRFPFAVTCFNIEGIDSKGQAFKKKLDINKGAVQALWFGVDIPPTAGPGEYTLPVTLEGEGLSTQTTLVRITVEDHILADRGDNEAWRHSRLRWLNSTLGIDDEPVNPYGPLRVKDRTIECASGSITLDANGLPGSAKAGGTEILSEQVRFVVETDRGVESLTVSPWQFTKTGRGVVEWKTDGANENLHLVCRGKMEFDGYISYNLEVTGLKDITIKDIRLVIEMEEKTASYFMGMGLPGGFCPREYAWKWKGPQDAFWMGAVNAGLYCELRGASYSGPLLNLYHPPPPPSWYNENKGGFSISSTARSRIATTYTGSRDLKKNGRLDFEFALLLTPVKKINPSDQFVNRYYHNGSTPAPDQESLDAGVRIINVHHASPVNPYINYPFVTADSIRNFVQTWHARDRKVKLYYTVRELTSQLSELWALRSLGYEIFADGKGGGFPWLREHLKDHYDVQWFTPIVGGLAEDAAIRTSGDSRWYNYYVEGLQWLVKNTGIDGLYLDDVSFDRNLLKRMRKAMDAIKPGCLIDLHSNTGFSKGPAIQYMEFFPYINKLWFGESFQYNQMSPENWMVEVSGIPFGLMGDMLQGGGNAWRGMVYGMTARLPWSTGNVQCDPKSIWKVWDSFGIADAGMVGYWEANAVVKVSDSGVLATAYIKKDKLLIALGGWNKKETAVTLTIDWDKIGWRPSKKQFRAIPIEHYQPLRTFSLDEPIPIEPEKGWLLLAE